MKKLLFISILLLTSLNLSASPYVAENIKAIICISKDDETPATFTLEEAVKYINKDSIKISEFKEIKKYKKTTHKDCVIVFTESKTDG